MSDNIREFPILARLSPEEKGTLTSLLVMYEGRVSLVRDDFKYLYDKKISIRTVKAYALSYAEDIEEKRRELLQNMELNPFSSRAFRYKLLFGVFRRASQVRERGYLRIDKDEWVADVKDDPMIMIRCLELAEKMDIGPAGLEIKRAALGDLVPVGSEEGDEFDMDDGLSVG